MRRCSTADEADIWYMTYQQNRLKQIYDMREDCEIDRYRRWDSPATAEQIYDVDVIGCRFRLWRGNEPATQMKQIYVVWMPGIERWHLKVRSGVAV